MTPIAVIDFETTGLSPAMGDRATEVAIVMLVLVKVQGCQRRVVPDAIQRYLDAV